MNKKKSPRADNLYISGSDINNFFGGLSTKPNECSDLADPKKNGGVCSSKKVIAAITDFIIEKVGDNPPPASPDKIVNIAANILGCDSESCVITNPEFRKFAISEGKLNKNDIVEELDKNFKAAGPRNNVGLLSNINIDETLIKWARSFLEFFPCPFAMMDFDKNGDLFGSINLLDVLDGKETIDLGRNFGGTVKRQATCFGCVLNTDVSSGPGKHWVAVFVDCRESQWTIEYFNSAGNPPPNPVVRWMAKQKAILSARNSNVSTISVTQIDHQESKTECGLYALYYIRSRIEKIPYTFFFDQKIPDDAMTYFRTHVFRNH